MTARIGVFDSGVGGLGVLAEARSLLPQADFVYVADHAGAPYGTSSLDAVRERARLVTAALIRRGCEVVVLACNTASAAALHPLRAEFTGVSFVGMEPAVKPAAAASDRHRVGVVATAATFQGELFESVVDRFARGISVTTVACERWVDLVERAEIDGPATREEVERCLAPLVDAGVDVVVLGCTHYPALRAHIAAVMGADVAIIDPAPAVARRLADVAAGRGVAVGAGTTELLSTGDTSALERAARRHRLEGDVRLLRLA